MQDDKLLSEHARTGSDAAFAQIVARHLPLVYRACRRELGSDTLAEDAAQVVFLLLARKAKTLRAGPSLAGWLFQTARFVAKDVRKQEARRLRREEAVMQESVHQQTTPVSEWDSLEPLLNPALATLKPADREAVLLRFFEGHTLAETGTLLGLSEDAARMRVTRALEKLRRYLVSHGAAVTSLVLTGFLTAEAAHPVPAHAAEVITQGTLQAISTGPTANVLLLSKGVSQTMKVIKLKYAALAASVLVGGTVSVSLTHALPTKSANAPADLPDTPQTVRSLLDKAQEAADADKTLTANFSYVVNDPVGGLKKDIGTVKMMKPNYAAISYNTGLPTATEIHSDGQSLWNYHSGTNSYTKKDADPQGKNVNVWRLITVGGFFDVYTWVRQGIYADPSELHYIGRQTIDDTVYQVIEHKMVGTMHGQSVPFDQKLYIAPDHLIHRFTMDFVIDGKPGTEYADLTNISLDSPMQPADFAYTPPSGALLPAQPAGTQAIVLQHVVAGEVVDSQHWDQPASLPAGVTKVEAVPAQNALAVSATPAGFAKVQEIVKALDIEPRQIKINAAFALASEADLKASGIQSRLAPLDGLEAGKTPANQVEYMTGALAAQFLQVLTDQNILVEVPKITTTDKIATSIDLDLPPASAHPQAFALQTFSVTPQINSDSSVTLVLDTAFLEGSAKRQIHTTRTLQSGETLVIVMPPASPAVGAKSLLLFVAPTAR